MKRRAARWQASNPVAVALLERSHRAELLTTQIAEMLAIDALSAGTANPIDYRQLEYMADMACVMGRAGYLPEDMAEDELTALCQQNTPETLRQIASIHAAQTTACPASEYLKLRRMLLSSARQRLATNRL